MKRSYAFLVIAFLVAVLYGKTVGFGFAIDDRIVISENANVKKGVPAIPSIFSHTTVFGFNDRGPNGAYRPLTLSTYAVEISLFGLNPAAHHFLNIFYYFVLCLLLYILLSEYLLKQANPIVSLIIVVMFLVHPIHTEVVSNIKSRDDILCFLLFALSLIFFFRAISAGEGGRRWGFLILSGFFYFLDLFTKETAVTFLPLFPLFAWFFTDIARMDARKVNLQFLGTAAVFFAVFLLIRASVLTGISMDEVSSRNNALLSFGFSDRYLMSFYILLLYLKLLVVPFPLIWDYSFGHFQPDTVNRILGVASLVIYLALAALAVYGFRKRSLWSFTILFFFITLSLVSNIFFPVASTMAERFLFIPSFAFCFAAVIALMRLFHISPDDKKFSPGIPFTVIIATVFIVFGTLTFARSLDWKDSRTLIEHDFARARSLRSGLAYIQVKYEDLRARPHSRAAIDSIMQDIQCVADRTPEIPEKAEIWYFRGLILDEAGETEKAAVSYRDALRCDSGFVKALNNLGVIYHRQGKLQEALGLYRKVVEIEPSNALVYGNMGMIYQRQRNAEMALKYYERCLQIDPGNEKIRGYYEWLRVRAVKP
jgi:protein O-mannosyl-transferase